MTDKMRSEPLIRSPSYLAIDNNNNMPSFKRSNSSSAFKRSNSSSAFKRSNSPSAFKRSNSPPALKRSLSSLTSESTTTDDTMKTTTIPDNLLKTSGVVADTQRSNSLSTLCAEMFTEWESREYLDSFYQQLLELQGS